MKTYSVNANESKSKIDRKTCKVRDTEREYRLLKYDDKYVCDNDEETGIYRSVIFSEPNEELLCFTPPKCLTFELFKERNPGFENILVTENVEGIMISLFWDFVIQKWEIASKGAVGGNYWFFRTQYEESTKTEQKTFRQMFLEALKIDSLECIVIDQLPKGDDKTKFCYNFVLQHPDNHIVIPIEYPKLYLVSVYGINKEQKNATFVSPDIYQAWNVFYELQGIIHFPVVLQENTIEEYNEYFKEQYMIPGIMFLNTETGDRACLENPAYIEAKNIRGNNPNLHYQYLCLRRIDKVLDFLQYFPQYKKIFSKFSQQFDSFVTNVYESYKSYYIKKEGKTISKKYFPLIYKLHHEVYIPSLHKKKIIMRRPEVYKQLLEFPPNMLFHYLYM
jgi:hypothetical protein